MFGILFDTANRIFFGDSMPEPLTVLVFGIGLFGITAGLRYFFNKQDENAKKLLVEINEAVIVEPVVENG
ncbi:MAG: hypothetical protein R2747_12315 [Pyrinomonadaceae bacterium]